MGRSLPYAAGVFLLAAILAPSAARAQQSPHVTGDYDGEIGIKQATLHLRDRFGPLTATIDHLDLAAPWMFTTSFLRVDGNTLSFTVPYVQAAFLGTISADGQRVTGTWMQKGNSLPATFTRRNFSPAATPSAADGIWLGVFQVTAQLTTRIQVVLRSDASSREYCIVDDLDLYTMDMECAHTAVNGNEVSFDIPTGGAHWSGTISADGRTMRGNLSYFVEDGGTRKMVHTPLTLTRQNAAHARKGAPSCDISTERLPRLWRPISSECWPTTCRRAERWRDGAFNWCGRLDRRLFSRRQPHFLVRHGQARLDFRNRLHHQDLYRLAAGANGGAGQSHARRACARVTAGGHCNQARRTRDHVARSGLATLRPAADARQHQRGQPRQPLCRLPSAPTCFLISASTASPIPIVLPQISVASDLDCSRSLLPTMPRCPMGD